jgi:hypothetical protein
MALRRTTAGGEVVSKTQTGTFFNEKWYEDNAIDVAAARIQHERAVTAANAPLLLLALEQTPPEERDTWKESYEEKGEE